MPARSAISKKPLGFKRRLAGWSLLVFVVLLAGVWVWSGLSGKLVGFTSIGATSSRQIMLANGGVVVIHTSPPSPYGGGFSVLDMPKLKGFWNWFVIFGDARSNVFGTERYWAFSLLYPLPVPLAVGGLLLRSGVRARRRSLAGQCLACGYDLTGLGSGSSCPECGAGRAGVGRGG